MRVAHILRKYDPAEWGGTESAIHLLASGLSRHGVASIVYAPRLAKDPAGADPFAALGGALKRYRAVVPVWGISAERRRRMIALGGNIISLDLPAALWREPRIDVVHSHALGRLGAVAGAVARGRGRPFVVSVHGGAYDLPPTVGQALHASGQGGLDWGKAVGFVLRSRDLFAVADAIITCNPSEAEKIRERHPGRRVIVQPHGVRIGDYSADRRAAARQAFPQIVGRKVLLMPGRIDPVKNQSWLVEQMAEVAQRHPHALLVLAGAAADPAVGSLVQRLIDERGLRQKVLLVGKLPPGDPRLVGLFQEARAVLLPSLSETFGLVILEAWAAGRPVISSRTSGASALIEDGRNGFLFDLARPERFHAAADLVLGDDGLGTALGAAGHNRAARDFDTEALAGRMTRLYAELVEEKRALRHPT